MDSSIRSFEFVGMGESISKFFYERKSISRPAESFSRSKYIINKPNYVVGSSKRSSPKAVDIVVE
jgi:hypothetical protein